ncbi:MAG: nitrilase-related carbon-nitrogen hydrolase [Chloroflexota bacterium]
MKINLGLGQFAPRLADIDHNLAVHLDIVREAVDREVDLLIFPELSLTGYRLGERAYDLAIRTADDDPVFSQMLEASRQLDLVASFVEVDERKRYFISGVYLSDGRLVHRHRKIYLPTYGLFDEGKYFAPGDQAHSFDTRFGRMGLLICEDFWHLSLPYLLWQDGADILLLISASIEHGIGEAVSTTGKIMAINRAYALLFTNFVIHVNRVGTEAGGQFFGGSTVFGPDGELIAEGPLSEAGLITTSLDLDALRQVRINLPLLRDERAALTHRELERILSNYD